MLDLLENGTENEKTYCAKYFSYIKDPLALDYLKQNAYSENTYLSSNCIITLALLGDRELYNEAVEKLDSKDEFEQLAGAKFLVSYGDKSACDDIINTVKTSSFSEHIASELPYLMTLKEIIEEYGADGLYVLNQIISGLGEVSGLAQVFDFELYDILDNLINSDINSASAIVLLNAKDKFETLTENDEYLFDETKDTKQEIQDIENLLAPLNTTQLAPVADSELNSKSLFVFSALEFTHNEKKVRELLKSENQTLVLKSVEILKKLNTLNEQDKNTALEHITNENIKNIILAI